MRHSILGRLTSAVSGRLVACALVSQCAVLAAVVAAPIGAWAAEPPAGPLLTPGDAPTVAPVSPPAAPEGARPEPAAADAAGQPIEGEALTRGPIHEAYAEMINYDPQPGPIAPKQPPAPVEELPPEEKPEGEGFVWISGYWWWDDERSDFIWLSGVWRRPPPGLTWVPGYWNQVAGGYQWVSGYWAADQAAAGQESAAEVQYLPAPPHSLEVGPSSPQPTVEYFWSPGYWVWYESRYVWRVGRWMRGQEGWVWIPPHYVWTPCGYVYVPGHWDYAPEYRGLAFCPVYFGPTLYARVRPVFVPRVVILSSRLHVHLFCRPGWGHYYFGDYYDTRYATLGFYPWFAVATARRGWDPLYAYHAWHFTRTDPAWPTKVRGWHDYVVAHPEARPPRTFAAMSAAVGPPGTAVSAGLLAARLDYRPGGAPPPGLPLKLESVEPARAKQYLDLSTQFRRLAQDRAELEQRHRGAGAGAGAAVVPPSLAAPRKLELPIGHSQQLMRQLGVKPPNLAAGHTTTESPSGDKPEGLGLPRHGLPRGAMPGIVTPGTTTPGTTTPGTTTPGIATPGITIPEPRNPRLPKLDLPNPGGRAAGGERSPGPLRSFEPPYIQTPQLPKVETPGGRSLLPTPQLPKSGIQGPKTGMGTHGGANPPSRVTTPPITPRMTPPVMPQITPPSRGRSRGRGAEAVPLQPRGDSLPRLSLALPGATPGSSLSGPSIALPGTGPGAIEPLGAKASRTARAPAPPASGIVERGLGFSAAMASLLRDSQTLGRSAGRLPEGPRTPAPRASVAPVPSAGARMAIQPARPNVPIRASAPASPPLASGMNLSARPALRAGALASPPGDLSRALESLRAGWPSRR